MIATGLAIFILGWFISIFVKETSKWFEALGMIQLLAIGLVSAGVVSCAWQRLP